MNEQLSSLFIEVVKSRLTWRKDVVWIKADNIVKESSELVDLAFDLDVWSRVLLEEAIVLMDLLLKLVQLLLTFFD